MVRRTGLDHRDGFAHLAFGLEKPQHHDGIGKIADIDVGPQFPCDTMLPKDHQRHHALLREIAEQFMHL